MTPSAILFDLLTGLLDSWTLWNQVAGSSELGLAWRKAYLKITYTLGQYVPYDEVVARAAQEVGLSRDDANALIARWDDLQPWPEARHIVTVLQHTKRVGVVTNCSEALSQRAVGCLGVDLSVLVSAERAGFYKPDERSYRMALDELGLDAEQVLYVAGSPYDVEAPARLGMRVVWHDRAGLRGSAPLPAGVTVIGNLSLLLAWA